MYKCTKKALTSRVYKVIANDVLEIHPKYVKWIQDLGIDFCGSLYDFGKLHKDIYKITNVSKYRSFQYRLLQRGIVTNIQLKRWKKRENDQCTFCAKQTEGVIHLFWECEIVKELWKELCTFVEKEYKINNLRMNVINVIFNDIAEGKRHIANFICLITKQYIYIGKDA